MDSLDTPCLPQSRVLGGVQPVRPVDYSKKKMGEGRAVFILSLNRKISWLLCFESCSIFFLPNSVVVKHLYVCKQVRRERAVD